MVNRLLTALFFPVLLSLATVAFADQRVKSQIAPKSGDTATVFILGITIEGNSTQTSASPKLTAENDFSVRYIGPQQNIEIINGHVSAQTTYRYRLQPKQAGELQSPSFIVPTDEGEVHLEPETVTVTESVSKVGPSENVTIERKVTKKEVFKGEQIFETIEIQTAVALQNVQLGEDTPTSFVVEPITPDEQDTVDRDERTFTVARKRRALFPIRSGDQELPPKTLSATAVLKRGFSIFNVPDPFSNDLIDNFLGSSEEINIVAPKEIIKVKELPPPPPDATFWSDEPLVGNVSIEVELDPKIIDPGETKNIEVIIKGDANIKSVTSVPFPTISSAKVYPESPQLATELRGDKIYYTKRFRFSVVATSGGNIKLPPFTLTYFDPVAQQYKNLSTQPTTIIVTGVPEPETVKPTPTQKPTDEKESEIAPSEGNIFEYTPHLLISIIAAILLVGAMYLFNRVSKKKAHTVAETTVSFGHAKTVKEIYDIFLYNIGTIAKITLHSRHSLFCLPVDPKVKNYLESFLDLCEENMYGNKEFSPADIEKLKTSAQEILTEFRSHFSR